VRRGHLPRPTANVSSAAVLSPVLMERTQCPLFLADFGFQQLIELRSSSLMSVR
jgi:hypothetical protein